ncbi:amino acid polyamine transport protein [Companilactobacillus tucceti DSM 20183]|uniref:Amino acid polyamine transport protein n=1 Tax=Companilactobacillus tucceti DSM 20183 TaxID=1423811 RepID=A0A0R1JAR4_9LACO|nr:amino acid permease [Companilactobacillus tucceti]KRK65364.1 amino acid polyamine transport protein [Companilactobacillus tucceti DSM 20183]
MNEDGQLKRNIGFWAALSTVIGTAIGGGVFFKTPVVTQVTGSSSLTLFSWLLGGLITIAAGLTTAELSAAIPKTGGMVEYINHTYGKTPSFLLGWAEMVIYFPANISALSIIFSTQLIYLLDISMKWLIPMALVVAASITLINLCGSKYGGGFQTFTTVFKLIPIALIIIFGLFSKHGAPVPLFPIKSGQNINFLTGLGHGLLATMFAYDGWIQVGNIAGELKNPKKDLPRAIIFGLLGITVIYLFINYAFLKALPIHSIIGNENTAADAAKVIFGDFGGRLVTIGILISVYGAINGYTMTGLRIPYALSKDKSLPFSNKLSHVSKLGIPVAAALLQLVIAFVMVFLGDFNTLTDMLVFVIWIFYTMTFAATIILRKREPDMKRPYKALLYPFTPIVAILGGIFIVVSTIFTQTSLALLGLGITILGLPVYLLVKKHNESQKSSK